MTSSRPYLLRALYQWVLDNECTPHILVSVEHPGVIVPEGYAAEGQIVLNLAPSAVRELRMENDAVSFHARFGGVSRELYVPTGAVMAIYARENGQGMVFEVEPAPPEDDGAGPQGPEKRSQLGGRPSLKVVK